MKTLIVAALGVTVLSVTGLAADPQSPDALAVAIKTGQRPAAIEMIAKKSADVNAAEADGSTPLLWAANLNDIDLASRLLKAGADPKARN
jgi:ankyrin repeat protein